MKPSLLLGRETHRDLADILQAKNKLILSGLSNETAKALIVSTLTHFHPRPSLLVSDKDDQCEGLAHWLHFFDRPTEHLQPILNEDGQVLPDELRKFLFFMEGKSDRSAVINRESFDTEFPLFSTLQKQAVIIKAKQELVFTQFVESLINNGYEHGNDVYLQPGEYRRIGDTLDIFPIQSTHPYRVLLDMDTVEKILSVDAKDLGLTQPYDEPLTIYPVTFSATAPLIKQLPKNTLLCLNDQDEVVPPLGTSALYFSLFPEDRDVHVHMRYLSILKFYTLTDFLNDLRDKIQQGWSLLIISKRSEELTEIFTEEHIPFSTDGTRHENAVTVMHADEDDLLPHSIQNPDLRCALLTDREIFSLKKAGKQRGIQKLALDFITSLVPGDYVVHMEHGIGHFEGMTQKEVDGTTREYLELTYAEGDRLFVPVDQADKLSKYVYEEGNEPLLTRLGTQEWKKVMSKAKEETQKIAKELLDIYAKRAKSRGHAFPTDDDMQKKFDASFPYQETPGQTKAIEDIKRDMEDPHPMDRLVCGDVGFGKTEVAMRAAFKAFCGGKQVAVIAPITILADQHYRNFMKRMEGFPVRIDMLSRFRSAKEQKATLEKLRKGEIDIIIGTHRLIQKDVEFFNLGLVVIDEEQRFGVKQKERFKELRASVDLLTMTATPIPRTLNLGLHKLRDITTITTPPPGRLPIITEVRKYSDALVRQAILTEIQRGGQAYVLHNRVETIDAFAVKLKSLIPEATFIVGHGQLDPEKLEERIVAFKEGKYDVLVSSTIIENGIDLPRANTLIVNEAEHFGLSQLYQLRGRVGRSSLQAFAYFLYHSQKLKDEARKRLRAIVEACELGSGFQVAMRDLEIRGAGEILGGSQSGNMQTVGVSQYLRMLKHAVEDLKAGGDAAVEEEITVEIQLPVEALLPSFYITDEQEKISVYQKLAGSEEESILAEFEEDLTEEYGDLPKQVKALFAILRLKLVCRRSGVTRVKMEDVSAMNAKGEYEIVINLVPRVTAEEIMQLLSKNHHWRIVGSTLRLRHTLLTAKAGAGELDWLEELTKQIAALQPKKKK